MLYVFFVLLALGSAFAVTRPLLAGRKEAAPRSAHDVAVFKAQLTEIDRDLARGVITQSEAEGARREISRRLLRAAEEAQTAQSLPAAPKSLSQGIAALSAAVIILGGTFLYFILGSPQLPDQPLKERNLLAERRSQRPPQVAAEQLAAERAAAEGTTLPQIDEQSQQLIDRMRLTLAERPDEPQGRILLARALAQLERFDEAWRLYEEARTLLGDAAGVELALSQGEAMVLATGGYVSPEAESLFQSYPDQPQSQYFLGLSAAQMGDFPRAEALWSAIIARYPDAPFTAGIREQLAQLNGTRSPAPGPSREEVEAAQQMSPEERDAMIRSMVDGLEERLQESPQDLPGWLRLIRALAILGESDRGQAAVQTALDAFPQAPERDQILAAAQQAGFAVE
ncbi:MAG: c-type cytochrome biogenesis protein CcmI [Neomegalonema sp.]|nr:c-type cytochrome biogenesis protein CcmI [Neomegalonema sp.]